MMMTFEQFVEHNAVLIQQDFLDCKERYGKHTISAEYLAEIAYSNYTSQFKEVYQEYPECSHCIMYGCSEHWDENKCACV